MGEVKLELLNTKLLVSVYKGEYESHRVDSLSVYASKCSSELDKPFQNPVMWT